MQGITMASRAYVLVPCIAVIGWATLTCVAADSTATTPDAKSQSAANTPEPELFSGRVVYLREALAKREIQLAREVSAKDLGNGEAPAHVTFISNPAVRVVLPLIPALAASSPLAGGADTGWRDYRLCVYATNSERFPGITGAVVPEPAASRAAYERDVLHPMYAAIAPFDRDGVLQHEWLNARGAIARFDRMAIEIRVLDVQETPLMDVAYAALIVEVLKLLTAEQWLDVAGMNAWSTPELGKLLRLTERQGETAGLADRRYLAALGFPGGSTELKGLWEHLIESASARGVVDAATGRLLEHYLRHGTLATRISKAVGPLPTRAILMKVYEQLCEALAEGRPFAPPAPAAR